MELIAAVDLLGGQGVRLRQGRYDDVVDGGDPVELARRFASAGAPRLHVVDLEGARAGEPRQTEVLRDVARAARAAAPSVTIQAAGGLRTEAAVAAVLDIVDAAVLGTAAVERPRFLATCAARWPGRIHASIDVRGDRLALDGWEREGGAGALDAARRLAGEGAAGIVVTDTRRDGTLGGPNLDLLRDFRAGLPGMRLVAAGGVRAIDDLLALEAAGLDGAIAGMALLTGSLAIEAGLEALGRRGAAAPVTAGSGARAGSSAFGSREPG